MPTPRPSAQNLDVGIPLGEIKRSGKTVPPAGAYPDFFHNVMWSAALGRSTPLRQAPFRLDDSSVSLEDSSVIAFIFFASLISRFVMQSALCVTRSTTTVA